MEVVLMAIENNNIDFSGFFIADVLDIDISKRRLAVHIPKLMPGIAGGQTVSSEISTTSNINVNGLNYTPTLRIKNTIWALP